MQDKWQSSRIQLQDVKAENCTYRHIKTQAVSSADRGTVLSITGSYK